MEEGLDVGPQFAELLALLLVLFGDEAVGRFAGFTLPPKILLALAPDTPDLGRVCMPHVLEAHELRDEASDEGDRAEQNAPPLLQDVQLPYPLL
ncbi:hypothetical protein [Cereibacter azotoformans]|uniref:hypothetical protein n=1 Tax=Cereibacter azotoformans TaxID=43057 RepID=UPI001179A33E|nr:hypothetical protein [Cereibacter azotoformans]